MKLAPVVVFAYNRPRHLRATLEALSRAELSDRSEVWVFCDGPKSAGAADLVAAVRGELSELARRRWFAALHVVESDVNLGLAKSIISGVSRVLATSDRVIVLEDDLIVSVDFLRFMNDCLEFYREDPSVGSVSGFCPLQELPAGFTGDVFRVGRNSSQGWGTWADRWREVDWSARDAGRLASDRRLRREFDAAGSDRYARLLRQLDGRIDSWSIRFGLWQLLSGRSTIYPAVNRIKNIGYDGTGVHSGTGQPKNSTIPAEATPYRLARVAASDAIDRAFHRTYSGGWPSRLKRELGVVLDGWKRRR
jgi:hypothetical protein